MEAYSATNILFEMIQLVIWQLSTPYSHDKNNYKNHLTYLITANEESSETYKQVYKENGSRISKYPSHHRCSFKSYFSQLWRS